MIQVDISRLVPAFLLNDRNGLALAKAMETGMQLFCRIVQNGIDTAIHVEKMPEWRLDELSWELGCLYDYNAGLENKRAWIRDAIPLYTSYGTLEAIYKYLGGYFEDVEVEESWQYRGEPFHFRVTVCGEWTDEKKQWAKRAIHDTKNIRSVLDDLSVGRSTGVSVSCETGFFRFHYDMASGEQLCGTIPEQ